MSAVWLRDITGRRFVGRIIVAWIVLAVANGILHLLKAVPPCACGMADRVPLGLLWGETLRAIRKRGAGGRGDAVP